MGRRRRSVTSAGALFLILIAALVAGSPRRGVAATDTTPPVLASLSISPTSVDTSAGPATITINARITDETSPSIGGAVPLSSIVFTGPGGQQRVVAYLSQAQRMSGSATDGIYQTTATLRWHAETGHWSATATLVDLAGNTRTMSAADLASAGLPSGFDQTGTGDSTPPQLVSVSVAPASVDTSLAAATISVSARLTDDLAGVSDGIGIAASQVVLRGPTGAHHARATLDAAHRTVGDALDGVYVVSVTLPRWSEQGTWSVESVDLVDEVGNLASVSAPGVTFSQVGIGDIVPPVFISFSLSTTNLDVRTASAATTIQTRITDDRSGVSDGPPASPSSIVFASPSGRQQVTAFLGNAQRISGNNLDGIYRTIITVPAHAEPGVWSIRNAWGIDRAQNVLTLLLADWTAKGFVGSFTVVSDTPADTGPTLPPPTTTQQNTIPLGDPSSSTTTTTIDVSASTTTVSFPGVTSSTLSTTTSTSFDPSSTSTTTTSFDAASTSTTTSFDPASTSTTSTTNTTDTTMPTETTTTFIALPSSTTTTVPTVTGQGGRPVARHADGYWFASAGGQVFGYGAATRTSVQSAGYDTWYRVAGIAATPTGNGYWLTNSAGDVRAFGDARLYGSMRGRPLNKPVVGIASTPTGHGYWLVATDGGIFSFGDAHFYGSTGALRLNQPIVGMTATASGHGYWFVAADGGIFSFGDAHFYGSMGAVRLNQPVVGMTSTPTGRGYWLVARDGGIFSFGDAHFYGSTGNIRLNQPIVGMAGTPGGRGYWFVAADGGIFSFGDARFFGSAGNLRLSQPIVGMASRSS